MRPVATDRSALTKAAPPRRGRRRGFRCDQDGAVAVEFALLALPFFAIIAAILETAFFFLASQVFDSAVDNSVRLLRTGQAQVQNYTVETYRTAICDRLFGLFDCTIAGDKLHVEVNTAANFAAASFAYPLEEDPDTGIYEWKDTELYTPGEGSQIVTVRVYYKWPTILDIMGFNLANAGDGYRLMAAVRVFRNEPF
ncbi:MAG: pilus assembly protein [Alphaproteobacteria bacterium]|nr:pilus assembly protein [Alphaproteobacteria bacterium]